MVTSGIVSFAMLEYWYCVEVTTDFCSLVAFTARLGRQLLRAMAAILYLRLTPHVADTTQKVYVALWKWCSQLAPQKPFRATTARYRVATNRLMTKPRSVL